MLSDQFIQIEYTTITYTYNGFISKESNEEEFSGIFPRNFPQFSGSTDAQKTLGFLDEEEKPTAHCFFCRPMTYRATW